MNCQFWNCPQHIGSIDELVEIARRDNIDNTWPREWETMPPRQLLNVLRENERIRSLGPLETYSHLDKLHDNGRLKVLRTNHAIALAGSKLENCASLYANDVRRKRIVLVLLTDENKKPLALGSHPLVGTWPERGWSQIYEACNKVPSEKVVAKFSEYSKMFRRWHRDVFSRRRREDRTHRGLGPPVRLRIGLLFRFRAPTFG